MIVKTRGIVVNHTRFSESSIIVHVFTQEYGMQSYMVNGVFGSKRRDKAVLLQPLNILDMEAYFKQGKEVQRIKEFKLERPLMVIPFLQERRAQAFFITELLSRVLRNEHTNKQLFKFITDAILILDSERKGIENFHLLIFFQLTRFLGFFPNNNYSVEFKYFDFYEGGFVNTEPQHPDFLSEPESLIFLRLFETGIDELSKLAVNVFERRVLMNSLVRFFELHFQDAGRLRSLDVLSDLFKE